MVSSRQRSWTDGPVASPRQCASCGKRHGPQGPPPPPRPAKPAQAATRAATARTSDTILARFDQLTGAVWRTLLTPVPCVRPARVHRPVPPAPHAPRAPTQLNAALYTPPAPRLRQRLADLVPATDGPMLGLDTHATRLEQQAATLALAPLRPHLQDHTVEAAAAWLRLHTRAILSTGECPHWQWQLALTAWLYEHLGIVDLLATHPAPAQELLAEAGLVGAAARQQPFAAWHTGRASCATRHPRSRHDGPLGWSSQ